MQTLENVLGALIKQIGRGLGSIPADQHRIPESRVKLVVGASGLMRHLRSSRPPLHL